ncbi:hypothetical protein DYQ86_15015 [Acidobacteria bacterium AB60]|nr:hypothetical protein DYQ86_15015 [Acidobacteria bacterium AB60]
MAVRAQAENKCPWLNEATATDLVGGGNAVGSYVAATGSKPAVCTFTEQGGKAVRTLQIAVGIAPDPHEEFLASVRRDCRGVSDPLKAIGNEAVTCGVLRREVVIGERVLGRVRDQLFSITLSTTMAHDPVLTPAILKMQISVAAEQVAGNLF